MTNTELQTLWWEDGQLCLLDQRLLPHRIEIVRCSTAQECATAIKALVVRGAPAIGCSAAYGMALEAKYALLHRISMYEHLTQAKYILDAARPTAINLAWATGRVLELVKRLEVQQASSEQLAEAVLREAHTILAEDLAMCHAIGEHGAGLIPTGGRILTHCNAGGLATAGYGTALAPIYTAHAQGRQLHVLVDETRPFLQGARLTAWELQQAGVDLTLITDNMAGYFMQRGEVDCVIVGADRIVANGDVANKIGTYSLAVLARAHNIPFYVAAPSSTIDASLPDGTAIPIEQRSSEEVTALAGVVIAPVGVRAAHPAFDVTPNQLVSAIITERGVFYPPYAGNLG